MTGYADWVCHTVHNKSKMSEPCYQYAVNQMNAVTAATDALNRYLGLCVIFWLNMYLGLSSCVSL